MRVEVRICFVRAIRPELVKHLELSANRDRLAVDHRVEGQIVRLEKSTGRLDLRGLVDLSHRQAKVRPD